MRFQSGFRAQWYNWVFRETICGDAPSGREPLLLAQQTTAPRTITYADSGVDIERANRTKQRIKYLAHKTFNRGVLSEIGGFGGLFAIDKKKYADPVLVSSVDGVGTKLKIAFEMNLHHTVGADLVNHCVNDIAVQGAAHTLLRRTTSRPVACSSTSPRRSSPRSPKPATITATAR